MTCCKLEMSCQVLIQLLAPGLACLNKSQQRLATIVEATAQLASNNISVCISLDAATDDRVMSLEDLNKLAPILQQLDTNLWKKQYDEAVILSSWKAFAEDDNDAPAHPWDPCSSLKRAGIPSFQQIVTASHVSALLPARNSIKSLSLYGVFPLALLAKFGNLQRLELHSLDADGQNHLSALRRLVELHLTFPDRGPCSMALGSVLDSNSDSLLHVVLTAKSWDDETYAYPRCACSASMFWTCSTALGKFWQESDPCSL